MREIKFRAWEKSLNEIIPVTNIDFNKHMVNTDSAWRVFNEIELMQYTGLKDKNGVEIYEGDILEADSRGTMLGDTFYEGFRGYDRRRVVLDIRRLNFWNYTDKLAIIGNIYENPELIPKTTK